jgi:hypothetical protein
MQIHVNAPDMDLLLASTLPGNISRLHFHERIHPDAERFFDAQRHIAGQASLAVERAGKGRARRLEGSDGGRVGQACGLHDFGPDKVAWMGRFLIGKAFTPISVKSSIA